MEERFTWIPFYSELAKALLAYKNNRKPLVDFVYSDLSQVGGRSLVDYIHMEDGSKVKDIDPFSLFAIFNRNLRPENKRGFLQKFKEKFGLKSDIPEDFDGIPTVNSQRAFFFNWADKNKESIDQFWEIFEGVVLEKDISQIFDKMVNKMVSQYSLTMILYWIAPDRFLNLDGRNRSYLKTLGLQDNYPDLDYEEYSKLIETVRRMMSEQKINATSFPELSHTAWNMAQTDRIWMYKKYDDTFSVDVIKMGSSAKGEIDFSTIKSKKQLGDAYRKIRGNTDVAIPDMYWKLIKDVKVGDIVVVFDSIKDGRTINHYLHGWGRVTSDIFYNKNDENPIQRKVEWHMPLPDSPIKETNTSNPRYFHEVKGIEAANIMELLGIKGDEVMSTKKNYWLSGYYIDEKSELDDFIAKNEWRAWFGEGDANQLNDAKSIQNGDILILKSTLTKGKKHNLPCMRIKAVAVVESDMETLSGRPGLEGVRYKVRFINKEDKDFDGSSFGSYRRTIQQCLNKDIIAYVESLLPEYMEDKKKYQEFIDLLEANKNLILTGAPGTGKTYLAKQIAKQLLKVEDDDELQKDKRFGFVQFHPSYDYTDFVEGLRPFGDSGEIGFERKDGVFKEFCKNALGSPKEHLTSFDEAYESLCFDIKDELQETVTLKSGKESTKLSVTDKNIIRWNAPNTGNPSVNVVSRERLRKLYSEYDTMAKLNSIDNINDAIRDVIGGCNTSMYYAILQEVILRISKLKKGIYTEVIPDINQSNNKSDINKAPSVFIIDEINRGEISKIFGELFFSIDPGYRGIKGRVKTQYQNLIEEGDAFKDGFYVPENVYIIGTMNDIDRSVESMDFAMRRRFAWKEVTAEDSMKMLNGTTYGEEAKKRMQNLNAAIVKVRGLGKAYQIGAAYFKKIKDYNGDFLKLWDFHLKGLLYEYLRGNMNAEEQLEELKKAYES